MKQPDIRILGLDDKRRNQLLTHWRWTPDQRATFAMDLVKMLIVAHDLKPAQIVERAMTISSIMFDSFDANGWVIEFPSYEEMEAHQSGEPAIAPGFK